MPVAPYKNNMQIEFLINEKSVNEMTWEEYETFERAQEGDLKLYRLRPILARFMLNGNNDFMEHDKAMKILADIPVAKIKETIELFMNSLKGSVVPKASGTPSNSPLEVPTVESASLVG